MDAAVVGRKSATCFATALTSSDAVVLPAVYRSWSCFAKVPNCASGRMLLRSTSRGTRADGRLMWNRTVYLSGVSSLSAYVQMPKLWERPTQYVVATSAEVNSL